MYRIYRNLHRKCFSIQSRIKGKGWRVTDYAENMSASNVTFRVYEAGRLRCIRQQRKNVHAFAIVEVYHKTEQPGELGEKATYNPMVGSDFTVCNEIVTGADAAEFRHGQIFVVGVK